MKTIIYFLLSALGIWCVATYLGSSFGIVLSGQNTYISALIFAVILTIVNIFFGTILRIISLPITFVTFGLFSLVITCVLIYVTDRFYDNITITNVFGYIFVAIIPVFIGGLLGKSK